MDPSHNNVKKINAQDMPAHTLPRCVLAKTAVVLSTLGLLGAPAVVGLPLALAAIALGHVSLVRMRKAQGRLASRRTAVVGLVLGYLAAAIAATVGAFTLRMAVQHRNTGLLLDLCRRYAEQRWARCGPTYHEALRLLSAGRQAEAEAVLLVATTAVRLDPQLVFAHGVCARSRWNKPLAEHCFKTVARLAPSSSEGHAAQCALALDAREQSSGNFARLQEIAARHRWNPLYPWLFAIQARDYWRRTGNTRYSQEAVDAYSEVLQLFDVGPVMVHHTYANVLDEELGRYDEALKHRRIAVGQGPATWSLHGMGNTFYAMKRYAEAADAYSKASQMSPNDVTYLFDWACALSMQQKLDECIAKCRRVIALDPKHHKCHSTLGNALRCQGQRVEALKHFREALLISHSSHHAYQEASKTLGELGRVAQGNLLEEIKMRPERWREAVRIISDVTGQEVPPVAQTDPNPLPPVTRSPYTPRAARP